MNTSLLSADVVHEGSRVNYLDDICDNDMCDGELMLSQKAYDSDIT